MDFDKDNFEEDNELAPLEEEEAGDVDEVAGVEIDEIVVGDDTEDESEVPKRASSGPKRGSASTPGSGRTAGKVSAGRGSSKSSGGKRPAKKASVGKSKSAKKSAKKKSGGARGKASKKSAKKSSRSSKKKKR
jgi:hypothetical protein